MALKNIAEEYFSNLNPIASRLYHDVEEIKQSFESLWEKLSDEEQQQIIRDSIIKPEIYLKYISNDKNQNTDCIAQNEFALKVILDENCSYRDEHSGPFSFKTRSQCDLTLFGTPKDKSNMVKPSVVTSRSKDQNTFIIRERDVQLTTTETLISTNSLCETLPKTGLDFLDNW